MNGGSIEARDGVERRDEGDGDGEGEGCGHGAGKACPAVVK